MIVSIAKFIVFAIEFSMAEDIINFGIYLLSVFEGRPNLELFFVMILVPFVMNSLQYWIQDNFLKGTEFIQ
jgi:hypothetical protein